MEGLINEARFAGGFDIMIVMVLDAYVYVYDEYYHGVILFLLQYSSGYLLSWV